MCFWLEMCSRLSSAFRRVYFKLIREMSSNRKFVIRTADRKYPGLDQASEGKWTNPFFFIQAADCQLGLIERYIENKPNPKWQIEVDLTLKAIEKINLMEPKPRFFIVCGDLVDAYPDDEARDAQVADLKKCFEKLREDVPLVCVCGNHDVGETPTPESIQGYKRQFGDDYFTFYCGGVLFIVLNSQYYKDRSLAQDLAAKQDQWLDDVLEEAKQKKPKHLVVFQHVPLFLWQPDEDDDYFNIGKNFRLELLNKFYEAGIRNVFCGHWHRNAGGHYKDLQVVTTSAIGGQLGQDKSGFRIVKVSEENIQHEYYAFDDVPKKVDL